MLNYSFNNHMVTFQVNLCFIVINLYLWGSSVSPHSFPLCLVFPPSLCPLSVLLCRPSWLRQRSWESAAGLAPSSLVVGQRGLWEWCMSGNWPWVTDLTLILICPLQLQPCPSHPCHPPLQQLRLQSESHATDPELFSGQFGKCCSFSPPV